MNKSQKDKRKEACKHEKEITKLCKNYKPGQAFLVSNGDSQRYWKLKEKCKKECSPLPREERDWDSWTEEFDDKWVDEHAEIVKADPKQLKSWIHDLLNSQLQEVRGKVDKKMHTSNCRDVGCTATWNDTLQNLLQALDEMEGGGK